MSNQMEKQAASQASILSNAYRQLFHSVPPIPTSVNLTGKTALVTGSNIGLGFECARHYLGLRLTRLIMGVRSLKKGEAAAATLSAEFPDAKIEVWQLDMESFRSVQAFAARVDQELERLHIAVLNAGLGKNRFERVEEGNRHEATIQVNYLSNALLAILLTPKMKPSATSSGPGHLVIVSSDTSLGIKLKDPGEAGLLDSLDRPEQFNSFEQYAKSKLLVTIFCARLAEVVSPDDVIINSCNPGATKGTGFLDSNDSLLIKVIFGLVFGLLGRTAKDASRIYVHASQVLGKESHGSYTDWLVRPWPVMMYSDLGRRIGDKLWSETMEELRFAGVERVLNEVQQ